MAAKHDASPAKSPKPLRCQFGSSYDQRKIGNSSGEGLLRRTKNLCLSSLIEAVRDQTRVVDLKQVNRVLIQPHWRKDCDQPLP